ncbi:hypothetical protein GYMLUDRAFT_49671 [Collybiopsis luxurians FD-317 M1]|uniref:N-acetyltransferase domain-containing protein n=1 Tax=Collybiopsis luxurians FD-317 M1 TaxID=944289 RepID=A0A0D0CD00_9AGAR|nr:hypothetical protein GYMLUDRAFT_49671 [Collybiopsis luxurians FD-317 M1]
MAQATLPPESTVPPSSPSSSSPPSPSSSIIVKGIFTIPDPTFRASISTHTPLLFEPATHEPYLPLPAPFERFRLTPNRESDAVDITEMMNDAKVAYWMGNHPFPFPADRASGWIRGELELTREVFEGFRKGEWVPAKGSPLKVIRETVAVGGRGQGEVDGDTTHDRRDVYVGDVDFRHAHWWTERLTPVKEGWEGWRDRERIWSIGAALKSSYHNQGIGSAALLLLFTQWGIPQIGATEVRAETFASNVGSNRIWEKLGFVLHEHGEGSGSVRVVPKEKFGGEEDREEEERVWVWSLP